MSELLKEDIGYVVFVYSSELFYIKTSFNPNKCIVKPGFFYDIDTGKFVPKCLIDGVKMNVQKEEPLHLKEQSEFWKSILLGAWYPNA